MSMSSARTVVWKWFQLEAQLAMTDPYAAWEELWETIKPGGKVHVLLEENQYHLIVELILFVAIVYLLAQSRASPKASRDALTEEVRFPARFLLASVVASILNSLIYYVVLL